ncbi:hypothetical protein SAMN05518672_10994 [Chitinophaga sp. CF118]|uniref:hypothetical protein n=1 Tax=Chitinophaga sp. CF118 TaxID=1884367 RepID=UPI0008E6DEA9|nr:hypothetical protein [Chitinophaga sp. CF118]SFE69442.1 hypothetical protein SAMN05518672_10994 [Chitinophaga sp. CF118]
MKLLRLSRVFLFAVPAFTIWACQKNKSGEIGAPVIETVQTSVQGRVLDQHLLPLKGATVVCGGKTTTTSVNGTFLLEKVSVNKDAAVVIVSKNQYLTGIRTLIVNENDLHYVQIMLHEREVAATFSGANGGIVSLPYGKLTIPPNAVLLKDSTLYNGIVDVNFRYLNPADDHFADLMAGDLRGITWENIQKGLWSYGMFTLELSGQNGEILHLDNNNPTTLQIVIPGPLQGSAPAQIPLWFFNITSGYWEEKGTATKQGDTYIATIKSTGFWHYAVPYDLVSLRTTIIDQHNAPVPNMQVTILRKLDFIPVYSYTDAAGRFTGKVPVNAQLIFTLTDPCRDIFYHQETGPFAAASSINALTITLPSDNTLMIDGIANNCANEPVQGGIVNMLVDGLYYKAAVTKGHFKSTILRCNSSSTDVVLTATDTTASISTMTTINANNGIITPTLVVCTP